MDKDLLDLKSETRRAVGRIPGKLGYFLSEEKEALKFYEKRALEEGLVLVRVPAQLDSGCGYFVYLPSEDLMSLRNN